MELIYVKSNSKIIPAFRVGLLLLASYSKPVPRARILVYALKLLIMGNCLFWYYSSHVTLFNYFHIFFYFHKITYFLF